MKNANKKKFAKGSTIVSDVHISGAYASIGTATNLKSFRADITCSCGIPGPECTCKLKIPPLPKQAYRYQNKQYLHSPKPTLLFTLRHHQCPKLIYSFFTKYHNEAHDEVDRLNKKYAKQIAQSIFNGSQKEIGWYLDTVDEFDMAWNAAAISDYRSMMEFNAKQTI